MEKELEFTKTYLDLERERFSDRLLIQYEIDPSLLNSRVPSMLLQPLVENALKHGISKSIEGGVISISVARTGKAMRITVSDTGIGFDIYAFAGTAEPGIGLSNTNQRLLRLYGKQVHIVPNTPSGLTVYFEIPIESI